MPFLAILGFAKSWWREFAIGALIIAAGWFWHAHNASEQRLGALASANQAQLATLAAVKAQNQRNDTAVAAVMAQSATLAQTTSQIRDQIAAAAALPLPASTPRGAQAPRGYDRACPGAAVRAAVAGIVAARARHP